MEGYDLFSDDLPTLGSSMLDGLADLGSSTNDQYVGSTQSNMNAGQSTPGEQHGPTSIYNPMYPSTGDTQGNSQVKMPSFANYGTATGYAQQQVHYSQVNQGPVSYGGAGYTPYGQQSMAPRLPANAQYGMYGDSRMYGMQQHPAEQYQQQMHQSWPAQMGTQAYPSTMGASAQYSAVPHPSYRPLHPPQQPQQQQQHHPAYGQPTMRMPAQSPYGSINGPPAAAAAAQMAGKNIPANYGNSTAAAAPGSTPPFGLHQQYQAYGAPNLTHASQQPKVVAQQPAQQQQQQQQGTKPFSYPMQPPYPAMNAQQQHFNLAESAGHQDMASLYPAAATAAAPPPQQQQQQLHPSYRAPFPQMSPQMSPRPQASPMSHQGPAAPVQQPAVSTAPTFLPPHHPQQHGPPLGSHPVPPQAQQQPMQQHSMPTSLQQLEQLVGTNSTPPKPNLTTASSQAAAAAAIPSPSRTPVPSSPAPPRTPVSSSPAHQHPGPSPRVAVSSPLPLPAAALSSPLPVQQPEQQQHRDGESQAEPPETVKSPLAEVKDPAVPPIPAVAAAAAEMTAAAPKPQQQQQQQEALPSPSLSPAQVPVPEAAPQHPKSQHAAQPHPPTPYVQPYMQQPAQVDPAAHVNVAAPPPHVETQQLQQQLQQLYSLPPNPQTQQQINDIHERLAVLQQQYGPAAAQVPPQVWPTQQYNPPPGPYGPPPPQGLMTGPMGPPPLSQAAGQVYDFPGVNEELPAKAKKKRERKKTPKEPKEPKTPKTPKAKSSAQMSSIESTIMSVSSSTPAAEQERPAGEPRDVLEAAVAAITEADVTSDSMKIYEGEDEVVKDPPYEDPGTPESTPKAKRTRNRKAKSSRKRELESADGEEAEEVKPSKPKRIRISKKKSKQPEAGEAAADSGAENFAPENALAAGDSGPAEAGSAEESTNAFSDSANASVNAGSSSTKKKRPPRVKASSSSKKRPSRTTLSFSKKNRRRRVSEGDPSDMEGEPAPSPIAGDDDGIQKRRSGRNTSRKKYIDDIDLSLSEEDTSAANADTMLTSAEGDVTVDGDQSQNGAKPNFVYVNTTEEDSMVVQHILASRMGTREVEEEDETPVEEKAAEKTDGEAAKTEEMEKPKKTPKTIQVEEYYVKYKNFSYLHCEWKTEEELTRGDKRFNAKLKRYLQKKAQTSNTFEFLEEETFNPDYTEVDRVLDKSEHTDENGKTIRNYLVKWRSLPYEDITWELEDDVDPNKIKIYEEFNRLPPKDQWKPKKRGKAHEWKKLEESPVYKNNNTLREYQLEGLNWLSFSWFNGRNCILADEMGLGKTIQSLTFIDSVFRYGIRGPFLVIAPLSTIPNWQREFESWTNLNVIVYHGSNASRNMIQEYEFFYKDDKGNQIRDLYKFNVLITTFEMIISDCFELRDIPWRLCVIDEAHRLKNKNCKLLEGLRLLSLEHRVLLSGTPLQNNISELFSLLNFLEPNQFTSSDEFIRDFGDLKSDDQVQKLQMLLKPMMLRRLKEDVEKSLAPKEETIIEVELTNMQKKYYRGILERNFSFLTKGTTNANIPNLMNTMMELRKCCIHPYLLNGAEEQIEHDMRMTYKNEPDLHHKALIQSAGKLVLIDKLLPKLRSAGHRVLIFSQMVRCLDILEDYLIHRKYPYERLDGRIRGNMRQAAIDRFCKPDSDRFVFLLCTKAGGLGINLTAADTVIIYDSDWNPQNDLQAQARCHRIGQQKMVKVYRLLTRNTYEREMFDKASLKLGLDKAVLQSMNTSQGKETSGTSKQLSKKEIEDLLKKGAYGALMEDDGAGDKFCEEDIDQILLRRTQIITLENEKGSTFSKASFASSNDRTDIDIDDPDFWKKWARKAEIDLEQFNGQETLVLSEPRRRTQIKRYGQDEGVMDVSELESSSNSDEEGGAPSTRSKLAGRRERRSGRALRNSRRGANYDEDFAPDDGEVEYGGWSKTECFKVEKGLLTFGWGRWREIMAHGQFRKGWRESDVEDCARIMLLFCIQYYHGDERVKSFVWDLITPTENGQPRVERNHSGLAAPLLRGRKGKKKGKEGKSVGQFEGLDWTKEEKYDPEQNLDGAYRRHASRYSNKIMLRVRLLYYIKSEIIGDMESQVNAGLNASALPLQPPYCDQPPAPWWDTEADISLLVGTYKHGYERYAVMRLDPALSFLARCGPPDRQELLSEMASLEAANGEDLDKVGDDEEDLDDDSSSNQGPSNSSAAVRAPVSQAPGEKFAFPPVTELNTRLRRLVTSYQRNYKKEELKLAQKAKRIERRERIETIVREREKQKMEVQQRRWTRREEGEFFRTISNFGVEYNKRLGKYDWSKFRSISRLDRKFDETLTEYLRAFCAMCKKACGRKLTDEEELAQSLVEPVTEERARRCLERLELLCKIREEVLCNSKLDERLKLCQMSQDLPDWWVPGKHDKDLLVGAAKHGLGRTDFYFVHDPELGFREILRRHYANEPLIYPREKGERDGKEKKEEGKEKKEEGKEKKEEGKERKEGGKEEKAEKEAKKETVKVEEEETAEEDAKPEPKEEKQEEEKDEKKEEEAKEEKQDDEKQVKTESEGKEEAESKPDEKEEEKEEEEEKVEEKKAGSEEAEKPKTEEKEEETEEEAKPKEGVEENNDETEEPLSLRMKKAEEKEKRTQEKVESKPKEKPDESKDKKKGKPEKKKEFEFTPPSLASLAQMDEAMARQGLLLDPDLLANGEPAVLQILAQAYQNPIRWPKDRAVEARLQHIVHAVEKNEWPVGTDFTVFTNGVTEDTCLTPDPSNTPPPAVRDTPTPASLSALSLSDASDIMMMGDRNTEFGLGLLPSVRRGRGRGRGRGSRGRAQQQRNVTVDMEAERARLRALLSLNHSMQRSLNQQLSGKYVDDDEPRPGEGSHSLRSKQRSFPPPAHQQGSSRSAAQLSAQALELMLAQAAQAQAQVLQAAQAQSSAAALASSMAALGLPPSISVSVTTKNSDQGSSSAPMDLSGGVGKKEVNGDDEEDRKRKNDDGMPPPGKEKKRRKLDEIVLGLSAAKGGQGSSLFASPASSSKSGTKSETSTPLGISFPRSSGITILPCSKDKEDKSSKESAAHKLTAQMIEAQALLAGLGRLPGVSVATPSSSKNSAADPPRISIEPLRSSGGVGAGESAKLPDFLLQKLEAYNNTPPHELKVSKWLAEQQGITPERPSSPDAELPDERRHRRSRIDPALLDWNRLSGDEHVSVINRLTGKKITGSKAPQLRDLGPWLLSNPMFNVDPKWAELVKEKGNLPGDLQGRVSSSDSKSAAAANPSTSTGSSSKDKKPVPRTSTSSSAKASTSATSATASTSGLTSNPFSSFPGMNPNFLALGGFDAKNPLLAAFDPKNPLFGALDPKTAALFGASIDPKNPMAGMDPKNPLLFPFGGLPGLGALGGLGGLGLGSMNNPLFSNLAGFMPDLASSSASQSKTTTSSSARREDKGKKPMAATSTSSSAAAAMSSSSTPTSSSAAAAAAAAAAMPFLFPNPGLLYGHLGLGGLGFPLSAGIPLSTAFSNLNVQAGLMNGLMTTAATDPASTSTKTTSALGTKTNSSSRANASSKDRPSESLKKDKDNKDREKEREVKSKDKDVEKDVGLDLSKSSKSDDKEEKKSPEKRKDNEK